MEEILEEQANLPDIQDVKEELLRIPSVIDVGVGFKQVGGQITDDISFRVYVKNKKDKDNLSPEDVVPSEIWGVKTDVTEIPTRKRLQNTKTYRPIKGGIAITNSKSLSAHATLGCLATLDSDGSTVLLTNMHVLAFGGTSIGDEIGQPGSCCCCCFKDVVGKILDGKLEGNVDCGIASIKSGVPHSNTIRGLNGKDSNGNEIDGPIAGVAPLKIVGGKKTSLAVGDLVRKVGISTGLTEGKVSDIFVSVKHEEGGEVKTKIKLT